MKTRTHAPLASVLAASLLATVHAGPIGGRPAKITHEYTLPLFSLALMDYSQAELDAAEANGLTTTDHPALGSGLQQLNGTHYLSVTDRGPTFDRTAPVGSKAFPLPEFTPTIVVFKAIQNQIVPTAFLPLLNDSDQPITGLPNGPLDDAPGYLTVTTPVGEPLPFNQDALDPEDIHTLPGGRFILVEEYGPSVVIVSDTGNVLKRYTPVGKTMAAVEFTPGVITPKANYTVSAILPPVLKERRANRGLEGIAVSPDGRTAYTVMQSPLGSITPAATSPYRDSLLVRILRMDISDPLDMKVTGQFVSYLRPLAEYPAGNFARDLKISAAAWVSEDRLLILERTDKLGPAPDFANLGGAKLILLDLTAATDVTGHPDAGLPLVLEKVTTDLSALVPVITPATTQVVLDVNLELPTITDFKLEGLSILNANTVSISNDNDFGIGEAPGRASKVWKILLRQPLR